ncbi:MAG TPA: DegT/DnrJ/EryC1/StrS family aminotransferase [Opitutaceae bacterium]|nr:DegT/DnrJ/EryC1/StrS family aminotransferase [Opitutaceae bacterium]
MNVPFLELKPAYDELRTECDAAYHRVMDSGWYLFGRELAAFESEYARYCGVAHCIGVANGLEALQLALMAAAIGPGDEVLVPSNTYIATWLAVSHVGATPVPVEPDEQTCNLDPARLADKITPRTRAILPVHLYGHCADMDAINELAREKNLFVLEDAAQSHGAKCRGRISGSLGRAAAHSFYPSKNLGAFADGGAVTTNDGALAEKLLHLRNYGSKVRYHHESRGLNSRLSELQAAFLRAKLSRLDAWNMRREALARRYLAQLKGVKALVLPRVAGWAEPVWHLFVVRTDQREALRQHLADHGVGTQIHYPIPPHLSAAYRDAGWTRGDFPIAEKLAGEILSLPLGPHLSDAQVDYVCATVRSYFGAST